MAREVLMGDIGVATADPRIAVPRADMSGPNAVEAIGEIGGEAIQGIQTGRALKGVQQDVERFAVVGEAAQQGVRVDPNTGNVIEGDATPELEAALKRVQTASAQKFKEIALEVEQRGLYSGSMMARLHTEKTIRDLSMQTPGFEDEIRRTAANVLGYDPMGFGMRQILDVDRPSAASGPKTKLDLWREEVELFQHNYNVNNPNRPITYQAADKYLSTREINNRSAELYNSRIAQGNASFEEILNSVTLKDSPLIALYKRSQEKTASGEGWDWKDSALMKNEMEFIKTQYKQQLLRDAEKSNPQALRDQKAMDRLDDTVNRLFDPYMAIVSRSSVTTFLENKGAELELRGQDFMRRIAPGLSLIADGVKNQAVAGQLMEIFYSVGSDPQAALWIQQHPELRAIFGDSQEPMAWLQRAATDLGYGGTAGPSQMSALSPEDAEKQKVVTAQLFKEMYLKGTPEQRAEHIKTVGKTNPKLVLGVMAADPQSFNRLDEESRLTVATNQAVEINAVVRDLAELQSNGFASFQVNSSTGEIVAYEKIAGGRASGEDNWVQMSVQPEAVRRYNLVHRNMYNNPNWRDYLTNGAITSGGEASGLVTISISGAVADKRAKELLVERNRAGQRLSRAISSNFEEDSAEMKAARAEVKKYNELYDIAQREADSFNSAMTRLSKGGSARR